MNQNQTVMQSALYRPILSGVLSVCAVLVAGIVVGYAFGFDIPAKVSAQMAPVTVTPVVVTPITLPPPPPPPVVPLPPVPVVVPTPVQVAPVTVTGNTPSNDNGPAVTGADGVTTVSGVTITPAPADDNPFDGPCCNQVSQPNTVSPVTVPAPTNDNPFDGSCCNVQVTTPTTLVPPVTTPTTPVVPPIIPPVIPPVIPPGTPAECTFLTASASLINPGEAVTLTWKTVNATGISIDNGVGAVSPVVGGSVVVHPTTNTTYTATVTGVGSSAHCSAPVQIRTTPTLPKCIALTATPNAISPGDAVTLAWQTENATSITIDNGVGSVSPVAAGSTVVHPTTDTTYTATVANAAGSVHCAAPVRMTTTPPPGGSSGKCVQLTADKKTINSGEAVVLSWVTSNATKITINNGIGDVTPVDKGSITVNPTSSITYEATVPGESLQTACQVHIDVATTGCTENCGGGGSSGGGGGSHHGGHSSSKPSVSLAGAQPLASVYLSDIPYTGLDLGPIGTALYWLTLILWSLAAAYLILFAGIPFAMRRAKSFGGSVQEALNAEPIARVMPQSIPAYEAPAAPAYVAPEPPAYVAPVAQMAAPVASAMPAFGQLQREGFKSFATGDALTIDDIVKGLSRESGMVFAPHTEQVEEEAAPAYDMSMAPRAAKPVVQEAEAASAPVVMVSSAPAAEPITYSDDISGFLAALLSGDRDQVFGTLRSVNRAGGDASDFLAHAVCALDDAYRARIDGTACHPEIARITSDCATNFLERLVSSLATAIDSSYSAGITGAKLAATRALAIVNG